MIIYRVEDEHRLGMYTNGIFHAWTDDDPWESTSRHPAPSVDSALGWNRLDDRDKYIFGFESVAQLRRWIYNDDWLVRMHEAGLSLVLYATEDYRVGNTQAVFRKGTAIMYSKKSLLELVK